MSPRRVWAGIVLIGLVLGMATGCRASLPERVRVVFLDVGQGDSTVIETPGGQVVVIDGGGIPATHERDGGDPGHRVLIPYLRHRGISRIDLLIATHPDEDHVQGLAALASHMPIAHAFLGGRFTDGAAGRLRRTLNQRRIPVGLLRRGQTITLDHGTKLDVLHPGELPVPHSRSPDNDHGIVLRLRAGTANALLTGDIEDAAEKQLLDSNVAMGAQLLKVAHHGSRGSTSERWIGRVRPRWAVISSGRKNRYGHPAPEVLHRLNRFGTTIFRTDTHGAIVAEPIGPGWSFRIGRDERPVSATQSRIERR